VAFPATSCRFRVPGGWEVVWSDLTRGSAAHSEARPPGDSETRASCDVPDAPLGPPRTAAAAARSAPGVEAYEEVRFEAAAVGGRDGWIWEYTGAAGGTRVRVLRAFVEGGAALTVMAPDVRFEELRPTADAMVTAFGGAS
jgi:hypothetical protein